MLFRSQILCILFFGFTVSGIAQSDSSWVKYSFDKSVANKIQPGSKIQPWLVIVGPEYSYLNGDEHNVSQTEILPAYYSIYTRNKDTLRIILTPALLPPGIALFIDIVGDSAIVYHVESPGSRQKIYKQNPTDTAFKEFVRVSGKAVLKLASLPSSQESIEGYVQFESVPYFIKSNSSFSRQRVKIDGYFRASFTEGN